MSGQYGKKKKVYTKIDNIKNKEKNITSVNEEIIKLSEYYCILKCHQNRKFSSKYKNQ